MTQFSTSDRQRDRSDSPLFWLVVVAGSLALHLAVLLIGRWYLAQPSRLQAAGSSSKPIEFVEIDPKAVARRESVITAEGNADAIAPSQPPAESSPLPPSAPPPPDSSAPSSAIASIQRIPPSPSSDRPTPSPQQLQPSLSPQPAQPQASTAPSPTAQRSPNPSTLPSEQPRPVTNSSPLPDASSTPNPQTSARPRPSELPTSENREEPTTPTPRPSEPATTGEPVGAPEAPSPQDPVGSPDKLTPPGGAQTYQGQIVGELTIPASARGQTSAKAATLVNSIQPIRIDPDQLDPALFGGERVLELRVNFSIDNELQEFARINRVDPDSPTLERRPNLDRDLLRQLAENVLAGTKYNVVVEPGPDGKIAPESDWEVLLRIAISPA